MGFLNFLKAKKSQNAGPATEPFPPQGSASELYPDLPSLPDAPEISGMPGVELPQPPIRGMADLELPEINQEEKPGAHQNAGVNPILPDWPKPEAISHEEIPELPKLSASNVTEEKPENWLNIPAEVPQLKPFNHEPEEKNYEPAMSGLVNQNNAFFLRADDFRMIRDNLDKIAKAQRKHHSLTDIKKEENSQYERINTLTEDAQRKLMHIDRTLFEN